MSAPIITPAVTVGVGRDVQEASMTLSPERLAEIRRLAEDVLAGAAQAFAVHYGDRGEAGQHVDFPRWALGGRERVALARALDPATVLAILDAVAEAEREISGLRATAKVYDGTLSKLHEATGVIRQLVAERDAWRSDAEALTEALDTAEQHFGWLHDAGSLTREEEPVIEAMRAALAAHKATR